MRKISTLLASAAVVVAVALSSCSDTPKFLGTWTSTTPEDITTDLPAAATATSLLSVQFTEGATKADNGSVVLSSIINITQAVQGDQAAITEPYEASVAATASVAGTWMYKDHDRDDLLLSLDLSTLNVNVDNNGVTFSQNMLTGAQQPQVDSLTNATAALWKAEITRAMTRRLGNFARIDDVKVHDGRILTFEIEVNGHDKDLHFTRAE